MKQDFKSLTKEQYQAIKVGDIVERMLGFCIPCYLIVSAVNESNFECGPWTFNRETGKEIDEDIPIDVSYISKILNEEEKLKVKETGSLGIIPG